MSERERDVLLLLRSAGTCFVYYLYDQFEYTRIQCSPVVRLYCPMCVCVAGDRVRLYVRNHYEIRYEPG